jgi:hypothetical protein
VAAVALRTHFSLSSKDQESKDKLLAAVMNAIDDDSIDDALLNAVF